MGKRSRLLSALDAQLEKNHEVEQQKSLQRKAASRRKNNDLAHKPSLDDPDDNEIAAAGGEVVSQNRKTKSTTQVLVHHQYTLDGDIHTESSNHVDQGSSNNSDPTSGNESGGDLPYSDIDASSDADQLDIVPHQRLTINNTTALFSAHSTLTQISSSYQPFSDSQVITSSLPTVDSIIEVEDDFSREIAFYKQSLDAATQARMLLREEAASFSRPRDFFAEMVKSDDHMGKIKRKMADQAAAKKATADAKRQRDLKKFGKQVQIAKGQERNKERKSALEKIETLKRKRRQDNRPIADTDENELFDVALEEDDKSGNVRSPWGPRDSNRPVSSKRHQKDAKFGFGGKKRFSKSGDTLSSGDIGDYSVQKMKAGKGLKRLGKSRRGSRARL